MTFDELVTGDLGAFFATGEIGIREVTYNGNKVNVMWAEGEDLEQSPAGARSVATIMIRTSDVPAPKVRDVVVKAGLTYHVLRTVRGNDHVKTEKLGTDERAKLR